MSAPQSPSLVTKDSESEFDTLVVAEVICCSENFNSEDAEFTYESCDGVKFRIHTIYLETHSGVLSPPPKALLEDVVKLPEESGTLERLFHFIYPRSQTNLDTELEPKDLWKLAEASEKYQVFPAMYACLIRMKFMLPNFAPYVLAHALKHRYKELADQAAPSALDTVPQDLIDILPPPFYKVWFTYYDFWLRTQRRLLSGCQNAGYLVPPLIKSLSELGNLKSTLDGLAYNPKWLDPYCEEIELNRGITRLLGWDNDSPLILNQPLLDEPERTHLTSKDGESFWIRQDVLITSAPGLILSTDSEKESIEINCNSSTLTLLLQFLQPRPAPDIGKLSFEDLEDLSYIAEDLSIFQAMSVCHFFMKKTALSSSNNWAIFHYAACFDYEDIMDIAAPHALDQPYEDQIDSLSPSLATSCSRFRHHWHDILRQVSEKLLLEGASVQGRTNDSGYGPLIKGICPKCHQAFTDTHVSPIIIGVHQLHNPSSARHLLQSATSSGCERAQEIFRSSLATLDELIKAMPPFSAYLL